MTARVDSGPLETVLMSLPQATLRLRIIPLVGTSGLEDDPRKPGPDGFPAEAVTVVRKGFQVDAENLQTVLGDLADGTVPKKIAAAQVLAALYHEAAFPPTLRFEGYQPKPVDTGTIAAALTRALSDSSWQVRAAVARLAAWLGDEPALLTALKTATRDRVWVVRLCAVDMVAIKLGKKAQTLLNSVAVADEDEMVRQMAFYHSRRLIGR